MPGIVGFIGKMPRAMAEPQLLRMVDSQFHESFYTRGAWIDEALGVYVGWTALSDSFSNGMPLTNDRNDLTLIFSGEEYSGHAAAEGPRQQGHSRSSYLVHLAENNPEFVAKLTGMFHGLLVDRARGTVTLFNDRYGMHRLYYHEGKDGFYFAA